MEGQHRSTPYNVSVGIICSVFSTHTTNFLGPSSEERKRKTTRAKHTNKRKTNIQPINHPMPWPTHHVTTVDGGGIGHRASVAKWFQMEHRSQVSSDCLISLTSPNHDSLDYDHCHWPIARALNYRLENEIVKAASQPHTKPSIHPSMQELESGLHRVNSLIIYTVVRKWLTWHHVPCLSMD